MKKSAYTYFGITVFCFVFYLIYNQFSHGVHSPYMTWLFVFPLVLGFMPSLIFANMNKIKKPGRFSINIYNSGVAAVTVSSVLRGIFDIAGTGSRYQKLLMTAGIFMLCAGVIVYLINGLLHRKS